jgi:hypothetical protein
MPETCASNDRTLAAAYPVSGTKRPIGSSRSSKPSSRHCITRMAVIVLVIDPIRYCVPVSVVAPALPDHASSGPERTPATIEGRRRSAW